MKRLAWIVILAGACWYGWQHSAELRARGTHEIVVVNHSGHALERIRVGVGGQSCVIETLDDGATARRPFRCERDGAFDLAWRGPRDPADRQWSGGNFAHGPLLMRHQFEFVDGGGVVWSSERKLAMK